MIIEKLKGGGRRVISEGKYLEITPILATPWGQSIMLAPVLYALSNADLGMIDEQIMGIPWTHYPNYQSVLPYGGPDERRISFLIRVLERSATDPVHMNTIDADAAKIIAAALQSKSTRDDGPGGG